MSKAEDKKVTCPNCGSYEQYRFFEYYKCLVCEMRHDGKEEC